jgi:hypothetical protein
MKLNLLDLTDNLFTYNSINSGSSAKSFLRETLVLIWNPTLLNRAQLTKDISAIYQKARQKGHFPSSYNPMIISAPTEEQKKYFE